MHPLLYPNKLLARCASNPLLTLKYKIMHMLGLCYHAYASQALGHSGQRAGLRCTVSNIKRHHVAAQRRLGWTTVTTFTSRTSPSDNPNMVVLLRANKTNGRTTPSLSLKLTFLRRPYPRHFIEYEQTLYHYRLSRVATSTTIPGNRGTECSFQGFGSCFISFSIALVELRDANLVPFTVT